MDQDLLSHLTPEQLRCLQEFRDVVHTDDLDRAMRTLSRSNWDVQMAIDMFFRGGGIGDEGPNRASGGTRQNENARQVGDPPGGASYLQWLFQSVPTALNPDDDSKIFEQYFESRFGTEHPSFFCGSYTKAVQSAYQNSKFLLVYLHSPLHGDSEEFCRRTLCAPSVVQFFNEHLVFWGGSTDHAEAYNLSQVLRSTQFPFLALLVCQSGRSVQLIDRIQGVHNDHDVLTRIQNALNSHGQDLQRIAADRSMRHESSTLRVEQDREYLEAQEEDRRLLAKREEERREREEKEELLRQQAELDDALKMSEMLNRMSRYEKLKALVRPEPPSGDKTANIKFQLPNGKKLTRNFVNTDSVEDLRNFLHVYFHENELDISEFSISTNYPKRTLDDSEVLEKAGLYPRGMLFVQDLNA